MTPGVLMAAPNGARKTKADHRNLPMTPDELAAETARCRAAGARAIHIHARDADGVHSLDPACYAPFIAAAEEAAAGEMVVQITTEAVGRYRPAEMIASVRALKPQAVSIALRELFPGDPQADAVDLLRWAAGEGIGVQHILYDRADLDRLLALKAAGAIPAGQAAVLFVLGRYATGQRASPRDMLGFFNGRDWPQAEIGPIFLCAFGAEEGACALAALAFGAHARIGFENNDRLPDGSIADSTAALIAQTHDLLRAVGRGDATVDDAREALGCGL